MTEPSPIHLIPLRDETVVLPGAWTAERVAVDKPAALPCPTLAEALRAAPPTPDE